MLSSNPRDNAQVATFCRQVSPSSWRFMVSVYTDVTKEPFSCLLFDLRQECAPFLRLRSHFLPHEYPIRVYVDKKWHVFKSTGADGVERISMA